MKTKAIIFILTLLLCSEGLAQNLTATEIDFCKILPRYESNKENDVNYKSGIDAYGKAVVPADLETKSSEIELPTIYNIPITVDLAERLNKNASINTLTMDLPLGMMQIHPDGKVYYQNKDISDQAQFLCYPETQNKKEEAKESIKNESTTKK